MSKAACGRCRYFTRAKPEPLSFYAGTCSAGWAQGHDGTVVGSIQRHDVLRDGCRGYRKKRVKS